MFKGSLAENPCDLKMNCQRGLRIFKLECKQLTGTKMSFAQAQPNSAQGIN